MKTLFAFAALCALVCASSANAAFRRECPPGIPETPAIEMHIEQDEIVHGVYRFDDLFEIGRALFQAQWNTCDGACRPATTGGGDARPADQPLFIRTSAPDSNACTSCHNGPRSGGAGDFVANVFVLAQTLDPVTFSVSSDFSNERNTLGMFGSGAIEMLAREMTAELQAQAAKLGDGQSVLKSKGVSFPVTIAGKKVVAAKGINTDLVVRPFHQAGVVVSLREFTVNAFNHHHGIQPEERFDLNPAKNFDSDYDKDGVERELTVGDITAATLYQAALGVPGRLLPADPRDRKEVDRGERLFATVGCADCHVPAMTLNSRKFVEPNPRNPAGTFSDTSQSYSFDMTRQGEGPLLEAAAGGRAIVRAYTDLKRHNLCDAEIKTFCNEKLAQGRPDQDGNPGAWYFITRKLWDVGNSGPYGHRGDLTTLTEAIDAHGGEARASRDAFRAQPEQDQAAIIRFLKTLQVLPAGSPAVVIDRPLPPFASLNGRHR